MLIFDRENWRGHVGWAAFTVTVTSIAAFWYAIHGVSAGAWHWPSGGSAPGLTFGVAGGSIILFEMLLWPRKSLWRGLRLGRTKTWMIAHIWLGLLAFPILMFHGGFHFSLATSTLAAALMWLLVAVTLSGCWGLLVQNVLPRVMLEQVPAETIYSQIDHILEQFGHEADELVRLTCGSQADGKLTPPGEPHDELPGSFQVVGTLQTVGRIQGKVVRTGIETAWVADSEPLLVFHRQYVVPYLRATSGRGLPLGSASRAAELFGELATKLRPEAQRAVQQIAALCDQRRQFDLQRRLHRWLHVWLSVHIPLAAALTVLMAAHVFLAIKYL